MKSLNHYELYDDYKTEENVSRNEQKMDKNHYELYDDYKTEENVSRNEQKMDNNHYNSTNTIDKGLLGGEIWYT